MLRRAVQFITSLRLTVGLLVACLIVVFVGTLAQVSEGLYDVQAKFFRAFFVYWSPSGSHLKIPVLPGGWLLGLLLLLNLIAAHVKRFQFSWKKAGILLTHLGLILLLVGQFFTELFQVENRIRLETGVSKNYLESASKVELAVVDTSDKDKDKVVAIPESMLADGKEIQTPSLPFKVHVEKYMQNSAPAGPMVPGEKVKAANGLGQRIPFTASPHTTAMDTEDNPTAVVQIVSEKGVIGEWLVSTYFTRYPEFASLSGMFANLPITHPQSFQYGGRTWEISLRPKRTYTPYTITLLAFTHKIYPGTDIPKDFSSKIHLHDPGAGENRDVLIYMNNPLRYHGETFYQQGFEDGDVGTILQVVRNPASPTPYVACSIVALGLLVQFLMHLFLFARKRLQAEHGKSAGHRNLTPAGTSPSANGKGGHR